MMKALFFVLLLGLGLFANAQEIGTECAVSGQMKTALFEDKSLTTLVSTGTGVPRRNFKTDPPCTGCMAKGFGMRYSGYFMTPETQVFMMNFKVDDGARYYHNGILACDEYNAVHAVRFTNCFKVYRTYNAGQFYAYRIEYNQVKGTADASITPFMQFANGTNVQIPDSYWHDAAACVTKNLVSTNLTFDASGKSPLGVKLTSEPIANTIVEFSSNCAIFSNCTVTLDANNYKTYQNITVSGAHPTNPQKCCVVVATVISGDPDYVGQNATLSSCQQTTPPRSNGFSYGDPHYTTLDGIRHDVYSTGDYWFVRQNTGDFAIQQRNVPCASASCTAAVAVRYGSATYLVYTDSNGNPSAGFSQVGSGMTVTQPDASSFKVTVSNGIQVGIRVGVWRRAAGDIYYLSVGVAVGPAFYDRLFGLVGRFDGVSSNDFTDPTGAVVDVTAFQNSWRVTNNAENLFLDGSATLPALSIGTLTPASTEGFSTCPVPPTTAPTTIPPTTAPPDCSGSNPPPGCPNPTQNNVDPCLNPDAAKLAIARGYCDPYFNSSTASCCTGLGVSGDPFYESCVCDAILTDSDDFVQDSVNAYYALCEDEASAQATTCNPCQDDCNQNGQCQAGTCKCDPGFFGDACDEDWNQPPAVDDCDPSSSCSIAADCPTSSTLFVAGDFFYGTNLVCRFQGLADLPATKISSVKVQCPLPTFAQGTTSVSLQILRNGTASAVLPLTLYQSCCSDPCPGLATCVSTSPSSPTYTCECQNGKVGTYCNETAACAVSASLPSLTYATLGTSQQVGFKIIPQPASDVVVTLASDCASLSKCSLTFTSANYDAFQAVDATIAASFEGTLCSIVATISSAPSAVCLNKTVTVPVYVTQGNRVFGVSYGDPHFITFDGVTYDHYGTGAYYATRDRTGEFAIQAIQETCARASCNYHAAVKFRSYVFYYQVSKGGIPTQSSSGDAASEGVTVITSNGGAQVQVNTPTGIQATVKVGLWKERGIYYLSVACVLPLHYQSQMAGLYGNYNGDKTDEFRLPNGDQTTLANFVRSWLVPSGENLFLNPAASIPALSGSGPTPPPVPNTACSASSDGGDSSGSIGNGGPTPVDPPVPSDGPTCESLKTPADLAQARAICDPLFNSTVAQCCSQFLSGQPFYEACICDYLLSQSVSFSQQDANNFFDACRTKDVTQTCNNCLNGCSGQGNCVSSVCQCDSGFYGQDCSEDWNMPPTPASLDPTTAGRGCATTVTVTGLHFFGTWLECDFDGVRVAATKVSNFQVSCELPSLGAGVTSVAVRVARNNTLSTASVTLTIRDSCCQDPCQNGATCSDTATGVSCACPSSFFGGLCQNPINCAETTLASSASVGPASNSDSVRALCPAGQLLTDSAPCSGSTLGPDVKTCTQVGTPCAAAVENFAVYPATPGGSVARGQCPSGFSGRPLRACGMDGSWSASVFDPCVRRTCPAVTEGGASWPQTNSNVKVSASCSTGPGGLSRTCQADGTWGAISGSCQTAQSCPSVNFNRASWPTTAGGSTATGTCEPGYTGTPKRNCGFDGVWSPYLSVYCQRVKCGPSTLANADFSQTLSGDVAQGTCASGFVGKPWRVCQNDGTFGSAQGTPCSLASNTCPPVTGYAHADYSATPANTLAFGTCNVGWEGQSQRFCLPGGVWETLVRVHCTRTFCDGLDDGVAVYAPTYTNDQARGTCKNGLVGNPVRYCRYDKTFSNAFGTPCSAP